MCKVLLAVQWPSWISNRNDFSCFWSTSYPDASYQVSRGLAQGCRRLLNAVMHIWLQPLFHGPLTLLSFLHLGQFLSNYWFYSLRYLAYACILAWLFECSHQYLTLDCISWSIRHATLCCLCNHHESGSKCFPLSFLVQGPVVKTNDVVS